VVVLGPLLHGPHDVFNLWVSGAVQHLYHFTQQFPAQYNNNHNLLPNISSYILNYNTTVPTVRLSLHLHVFVLLDGVKDPLFENGA